MKTKTIKKIIKNKMDDWFNSIEDVSVRTLAQNNTIVTGGCITSMLLNEKVNDYDLYFTNRETALAIANYYLGRFEIKDTNGIKCPIYIDDSYTDRVKIVIKSAGIASEGGSAREYEYFEGSPDERADSYVSDIISDPGEIEDVYDDVNEKAQEIEDGPKYRAVFMSTNAITLSHRIQLVLRFFGEPTQIHENFDFVHCTNYWTSKDDKLVLNQPALEAILTRELRYVGSKYPLCSLMRIRKFIKRGWNINAGQILKAVMQLQELDLTSVDVLEDQLTGVDSAYFTQVVKRLKDKDPDRIDQAYLIEIIDRMF